MTVSISDETFARLVGSRGYPVETYLFEVSAAVVESSGLADATETEWGEPVCFRFRREDGSHLVTMEMRRVS